MSKRKLGKKIRDSTNLIKDFNEKNVDRLDINSLEHQKDFKSKRISENKRFDEKIESKKSRFLSDSNLEIPKKRRIRKNIDNDVYTDFTKNESNKTELKEEIEIKKENVIETNSDKSGEIAETFYKKTNFDDVPISYNHKKELQKKSKIKVFKENTENIPNDVYDPLNKDLDNDGVIDRYDNNVNDSEYFSSTYDVEKEKTKDVIARAKNKRRNYFKNEIFTRDKGKNHSQKVVEILNQSKESKFKHDLDNVDSLLATKDKKLRKLKYKKDSLLDKEPKENIFIKSNKKMLGAMAGSSDYYLLMYHMEVMKMLGQKLVRSL